MNRRSHEQIAEATMLIIDPIYVPLAAALAGALVGSFSSIGTIYVQSKITSKRERMKQAVELAIEDHRASREIGQMHQKLGRAVELPPLTAYLHYHEEVLRAFDAGGVNPAVLRKIREKNKAIMDVFVSISEEVHLNR